MSVPASVAEVAELRVVQDPHAYPKTVVSNELERVTTSRLEKRGFSQEDMQRLRLPFDGETFLNAFQSESVEDDKKYYLSERNIMLDNWTSTQSIWKLLSESSVNGNASTSVIYIDGCMTPFSGVAYLPITKVTEAIRSCPNLTVFKARKVNLYGDENELAELGNRLSHLRHVSLRCISANTLARGEPVSMDHLVPALKQVPIVEIFDCEFSRDGYINMIAPGSAVESFTMQGLPAKDALNKSFWRWDQQRRVRLLTPDGFIKEDNPMLRELFIPCAPFWVGSQEAFCGMLEHYPNLTSLLIEVSSVDDALELFKAAKDKKSLKTLAVLICRRRVCPHNRAREQSSIEDELTAMLKANTNIKQLFVQQQLGAGEDWESLVKGPRVLAQLTFNRWGRDPRTERGNENYGRALGLAAEMRRPDLFFGYLCRQPATMKDATLKESALGRAEVVPEAEDREAEDREPEDDVVHKRRRLV